MENVDLTSDAAKAVGDFEVPINIVEYPPAQTIVGMNNELFCSQP